jgi:hypothetical protein
MELLYHPSPGKRPNGLRRGLIGLGWRFGFINNLWKQESAINKMILFLVDDNIFVKDFFLDEAIQCLMNEPEALGFSLRLGTNTTYCYTLDKNQALPTFIVVHSPPSKQSSPAILKYDWTAGDADFGYPLEVSSSIYRLDDILSVLNRLSFMNPNFMESKLSRQASRFNQLKPYLLCYENSVTFCNPVNKVQTAHQNRAGEKFGYTVEELAHRYELGERIKVTEYEGFIPTGCHQEVDLFFESRR